MGAEGIEEADAAGGIADGDELLAEDVDADGSAVGAGELLGEGDGQPEAAEHLAHWRAGVGIRYQFIVFFRKHCSSPGTFLQIEIYTCSLVIA
jgi:hypothetical protein